MYRYLMPRLTSLFENEGGGLHRFSVSAINVTNKLTSGLEVEKDPDARQGCRSCIAGEWKVAARGCNVLSLQCDAHTATHTITRTKVSRFSINQPSIFRTRNHLRTQVQGSGETAAASF